MAAHSTSRISVQNVGKRFCRSLKRSMWYGMRDVSSELLGLPLDTTRLRRDEFWALDNVSFDVAPGECLGVIGPNGAGKSTLLKMIAGIIPPDRGTIRVRGRVGCLIEVGAGFHPLLSGRDNVYISGAILGMSRREIQSKFDDIVSFAGLESFIDSPVKHFSSGMFVRLGFSIAVHANPEVLLVDEALAVGDHEFTIRCRNRIAELQRCETSIVLVSHSEMLIREISQRCILMARSVAQIYPNANGAYDAYYSSVENNVHNAPVDINYNGRIRIVSVQNSKVPAFVRSKTDEPLLVTLQYECAESLDDTSFCLRLWNSSGGLVLELDSKSRGLPFDVPAGPGTIEITLDPLPLSPGSYWFAGGFRRSTEILSWSTRIINLQVTSAPGQSSGPGVLQPRASWSLTPEIFHRTQGQLTSLTGKITS
ncbi:MAG: ATP-binding cassette domain-containing protein [Chromatiales bacterium]|nr:ATP-binding cassette domain-containing protein [Chromatiales bacterium]